MKENWDKENIIDINVKDADYLAAIQLAQDGLDIFIPIFSDRQNNKLKFFIKKKFEEYGHVEHMWSEPVDYKDNVFAAILDNVPNKLKSVQCGDVISIDRTDVEDFLIIENGEVLLGDFIRHAMKD